MNSKSKTTEDILREMREYADQLDNDGDITGADFRDFANQLEAAMKREKVEAVTIAATKAVNLTDEKWLRDTGNAAALRRALEDTEELLEHFAKPGTMLHSAFFLRMRDNRAALAAPPRNCDVGSAEEQAGRCRNFGDRYNPCAYKGYARCAEDCPVHLKLTQEGHGELQCQLEWAQMPYEEGGAGCK